MDEPTPDDLANRYPDIEIVEVKMWPKGDYVAYRWTLQGDDIDTYGNAMSWADCVARMDDMAKRP